MAASNADLLDQMSRRNCNQWAYRGYEIDPDRDCPAGGWTFKHPQYDGPQDPRCGHATTIADAVLVIDDLHATYPEAHAGCPNRNRPLVCHGSADRNHAPPAGMIRELYVHLKTSTA